MKSYLNDRCEYEPERDENEVVQRCWIIDFGQICASFESQEGHCQYGSHSCIDFSDRDSGIQSLVACRENAIEIQSSTETDSISSRFAIQPKGNPGQDDEENAWSVHLDQETSHMSMQIEVDRDHRIVSLKICIVNRETQVSRSKRIKRYRF